MKAYPHVSSYPDPAIHQTLTCKNVLSTVVYFFFLHTHKEAAITMKTCNPIVDIPFLCVEIDMPA